MLKAGAVTKFRHRRDGDSERHAAQSLQGCDHRVEAPGFDLLLECLFETLPPFRLFIDSADINSV